jgi:hypothetical protein
MWRAANEQSRKLGWLLFVPLLCPTCVRNRNDAPAHGYILDLATAPSPQPLEPLHSRCGDLRYLIATATVNGRARLNGEEMPLDELAIRIRGALHYRAFKLVYVNGDARASWSDFITMVDRIWPEAEVVSLITPEVERLAGLQHCLAPSCGQCEELRSIGHR